MPAFVPPTAWDSHFADRHPWAWPLAAATQHFRACSDWPSVSDYTALLAPLALCTASGLPLRFVLQPPARRKRRPGPSGLDALYDGRIYTRGEVSTRPRNWHDWLNALVWASFPRSKAMLNARQYNAHRARLGDAFVSLPGARTREQDALAMLDEGSLLLLTSPTHLPAVRHHVSVGDSRSLSRMLSLGEAHALLFGHALYEHLVAGDTSPRGMPVVLSAPESTLVNISSRCAAADQALATELSTEGSFMTVPLSPGVFLAELPWAEV